MFNSFSGNLQPQGGGGLFDNAPKTVIGANRPQGPPKTRAAVAQMQGRPANNQGGPLPNRGGRGGAQMQGVQVQNINQRGGQREGRGRGGNTPNMRGGAAIQQPAMRGISPQSQGRGRGGQVNQGFGRGVQRNNIQQAPILAGPQQNFTGNQRMQITRSQSQTPFSSLSQQQQSQSQTLRAPSSESDVSMNGTPQSFSQQRVFSSASSIFGNAPTQVIGQQPFGQQQNKPQSQQPPAQRRPVPAMLNPPKSQGQSSQSSFVRPVSRQSSQQSQDKRSNQIANQRQVASTQPSNPRLPQSVTRAASGPSSKPASKSKAKKPQQEEDEEPEYQDDYGDYDDEEQGEDDEDYYNDQEEEGEDEQESTPSPQGKSPPPKEMVELLKMLKQSDPNAKNLCLHFVTDQCMFGAKCKSQHDQQLKKEFQTQMLKFESQLRNGKVNPSLSKAQSLSQQPAQRPEVVKNNGLDLRSTLLGKNNPINPVAGFRGRGQVRVPNSDPQQTHPNQSIGLRRPVISQEEEKVEVTLPPRTVNVPVVSIIPPIVSQNNGTPSQSPPYNFDEDDSSFEPALKKQESIATTRDYALIVKKRAEIIGEFDKMRKSKGKFIIPGVAEVLQMCPNDEIQQRGYVEQSSIMPFERDEKFSNFEIYAIKCYNRSAADKQMNRYQDLRPPIVLYKTVEYLRECIADLDRVSDQRSPYATKGIPSFMNVYGFFRDRAKSITQDFGILNKIDDQYFIMALEEVNRFLICALHDGFTIKNFEMKQHMDIINANLASLMKCYEFIRLKYPDENDRFRQQCLKNETESLCYQLLNFANSSVTTHGIINGIDLSKLSKSEQSMMKEAIQLNMSVESDDVSSFFKYLKRTSNYMFSCMILPMLNPMRQKLLDALVDGYVKTQPIKLKTAQKFLLFEEMSDVKSFARACGYQKLDDESISKVDRITGQEQIEMFKKWSQAGNLKFLDQMRGSTSRCSIMQSPLIKRASYQRIEVIPKSSLITQVDTQAPVIQKQIIPPIIPGVNSNDIPKVSIPIEVPKNVQPLQPPTVARQPAVSTFIPSSLPSEPQQDPKALKEAQEKIAKDQEASRQREEKEKKANEEAAEKKKKDDEAAAIQLDLSIRWYDAQDKLQRWSRKLEFKSLIKELKSKAGQISLFTTKKRVLRDYKNQREEDILVEDYINDCLKMINDKELLRKVKDNYQSMVSIQTYSVTQEVAQQLGNQVGLLKVKIFTNKANRNNEVSLGLIQGIKDLFGEMSSLKTDKLAMKFVLKDFPTTDITNHNQDEEQKRRVESLMSDFMGSNLIIIFSTSKSLNGDIQKVKNALSLCSRYSGFCLLWILQKNGDELKLKINTSEKAIQEAFKEEMSLQKISHLNVSTIYSNKPIPVMKQQMKKLKKSNIESISEMSKLPFSRAILSFIKVELMDSISHTSIFPSRNQIAPPPKFMSIQEAFQDSDICSLVSLSTDQKSLNLLARKVINNHNIDEGFMIGHNEFQGFNLLLLILQNFFKGLESQMRSTIRQISQQFKFDAFNMDLIGKLTSNFNQIKQIQALQPLICSNQDSEKMSSVIEESLKGKFSQKSVQSFCKKVDRILAERFSRVNEPHLVDIIVQGAKILSCLVSPMFESLDPQATYIHSKIDVQEYSEKLKEHMHILHQGIKKFETNLAKKQSLSMKQSVTSPSVMEMPNKREVKLYKKLSASEQLSEELKMLTDPSRLENKRKELQGKLKIQFNQEMQAYHEKEGERLAKVLSMYELDKPTPQQLREQAQKSLESQLEEHHQGLEEMQKYIEEQASQSRKRARKY